MAKRALLFLLVFASLLTVRATRASAALLQDPDALKQATQEMRTTPAHEPTAAELSKNENVGTALMRTFGSQEYEFRSRDNRPSGATPLMNSCRCVSIHRDSQATKLVSIAEKG